MVAVEQEFDSYVGKDLGAQQVAITPELVQRYVEAVLDDHPWYRGPSPFGGPVAPALVLHSAPHRFGGWYLKNRYGNLHAKQEWWLFHPIPVGETVTLRALIVDRYLKRGRDYVVNEATISAADGRILARVASHQSFLPDDRTQGIVVDKDRERAPGRRFEIQADEVLEELPSVRKLVDEAMCERYSGPARNYHNDREEARKLGFPDIVVQGTMSTCFISELMTRRFGPGWWRGGRMSVNFVNILWVNEAVTARGIVTARTPEGERVRHHCQVWVEKDDGTKVTIGTASAVEGW
jgi:hypothetical protein